MENNAKEYIDILTGLEPVFKRAGKMALGLRGNTAVRNKHQTGVPMIDIVTEADLAVQEFILSKMAKTKLVECQLFAEEDTPSVPKFKGTSGLVLTLDPIDGTAIYTSTGRFFSTIVSLNDKKSPLYTYCYYPALDWARRIAQDQVTDFGKLPSVDVKNNVDLSKTIVFTIRGPKKIDPNVYGALIKEGYTFSKAADITDESGSCTLLYLNQVAGYYIEGPNPYDGLCALHYGQAKKLKIYSALDLSTFKIGDHGPHYIGWYLILQK